MKNYYEILQVKDFAEPEVIKASYKALSMKYHPDINKAASPDIMVSINEAYEILKDPNRKAAYDAELHKQKNTAENNDYSKENSQHASSKETESVTPHFQCEPKTKAGKAAQTIGRGLWTVVNSFLDGAREL